MTINEGTLQIGDGTVARGAGEFICDRDAPLNEFSAFKLSVVTSPASGLKFAPIITKRSLQKLLGAGLMRTHMGTLTKRELVVTISNETGLVQHQVFDVVQKTLDHLTDALAKGDTVELRNFGVFEVRLTKARVGRNPNKPGSSFVIPPRATVKFKSGKIMRQKVSKLSAEMKRAEQEK